MGRGAIPLHCWKRGAPDRGGVIDVDALDDHNEVVIIEAKPGVERGL